MRRQAPRRTSCCGTSATTVLKNPRTAAKKRGRNQVALASEAPRTAPAPSLQAELRTGVACGELRLHFQPVVDVSVAGERTVVAAEALVRWQHPRLGLLALRAAADG
ncbi:MAG TPA: EAL domain-containing protein [Cellulomonas sp.]|nr:EAL domain-containing protein [Cellulomonas sp.]